jgi:hypothetical protein
LNACVKTTEMFICEKILTTSGKKITSIEGWYNLKEKCLYST